MLVAGLDTPRFSFILARGLWFYVIEAFMGFRKPCSPLEFVALAMAETEFPTSNSGLDCFAKAAYEFRLGYLKLAPPGM